LARVSPIAEALQGTTHTPAEESAGNHSGFAHSCIAGHGLLASVSQNSRHVPLNEQVAPGWQTPSGAPSQASPLSCGDRTGKQA
jgi:hypothetical protein